MLRKGLEVTAHERKVLSIPPEQRTRAQKLYLVALAILRKAHGRGAPPVNDSGAVKPYRERVREATSRLAAGRKVGQQSNPPVLLPAPSRKQ